MEFKEFAQRPHAYAKLYSMIGPSMFCHSDVKKAIVCLLFGGSKQLTIKNRKQSPTTSQKQNNRF
jgi:DNA replicative helicase MCM subunit Mcm2 (Cdc46/Mcm family)